MKMRWWPTTRQTGNVTQTEQQNILQTQDINWATTKSKKYSGTVPNCEKEFFFPQWQAISAEQRRQEIPPTWFIDQKTSHDTSENLWALHSETRHLQSPVKKFAFLKEVRVCLCTAAIETIITNAFVIVSESLQKLKNGTQREECSKMAEGNRLTATVYWSP